MKSSWESSSYSQTSPPLPRLRVQLSFDSESVRANGTSSSPPAPPLAAYARSAACTSAKSRSPLASLSHVSNVASCSSSLPGKSSTCGGERVSISRVSRAQEQPQSRHLQHQTKLRAIEPARPVGVPKGEELPNPLLDLALQLVLPAHARGVRRRHRVPPPGPALLDGPSAPPVVEPTQHTAVAWAPEFLLQQVARGVQSPPNAEPQHALLQPVRLVVVPFQPRLHAPRDESLDGRRVKVRRDSTERFVHRDFGRTRALGPRASLSPLCSDSRGSARLLLLCEELPLIGKSSRRDAKRHDRPSFVRRARTNTRLNPHRCPEREKVGSRAEEKSCSDQASPHGDYDYAGSEL